MPMTYRRPPITEPMTSDNTHLPRFSDDLRRPLPMTSDNTPPPLKGEHSVAGSPLGELPTHGAAHIARQALAYAGMTPNKGPQS